MNSVNIAETLNTIHKANAHLDFLYSITKNLPENVKDKYFEYAHLDFLCNITKNLPKNVKDKYIEYLSASVEAEIKLENLLKTVQICEKPEPTTSLH